MREFASKMKFIPVFANIVILYWFSGIGEPLVIEEHVPKSVLPVEIVQIKFKYTVPAPSQDLHIVFRDFSTAGDTLLYLGIAPSLVMILAWEYDAEYVLALEQNWLANAPINLDQYTVTMEVQVFPDLFVITMNGAPFNPVVRPAGMQAKFTDVNFIATNSQSNPHVEVISITAVVRPEYHQLVADGRLVSADSLLASLPARSVIDCASQCNLQKAASNSSVACNGFNMDKASLVCELLHISTQDQNATVLQFPEVPATWKHFHNALRLFP